VNSKHTYLYIIESSHYYNSAVKYTYALPTAFKSRHQAYLSGSVHMHRQLLHRCLYLYFLI